MLLSGNDPVDNPFHFDPLRIYGDAGVSELTQLIECMVTLDSEQRPQSARAVQEELQHVIDLQQPVHTQPVGATPPPPIVAQLIDSSNGGLGQRVQQMMVQRQQIRRQRQQYWSFNRRKSRRTFITTAAAIVGGVTIAGSGLGALIEFSRPEGIAISGTGQDSSIEGSGAGKDALFQIPYSLDSSFTDGFMVQALAWSPDGTRVALSAYKNVCIQTVDSANVASTYTGDVLALQEASDAIQTLAWRPKIADGIAFTSDSTLYLWSGAWSGKHGAPQASLLHTIQAQQPASVPLKALAWSPDGQSIAIPFSDGIQVWNASTRKLVKNLHLDHARMPATDKSTPLSLAWSPDGTYIAAALGDASPLFWRVSDGKMFTLNIDRVVAASMFAWSPSEKFMALAAGTGIYIIALANALSPDPQHPEITDSPYPGKSFYGGHQGDVTAISWSPDGRYIASGSDDTGNNLHVWTPFSLDDNSPPPERPTVIKNILPMMQDNFTFYMPLARNNIGIQTLSWSPNGNMLAVGTDSAYVIALNTGFLK